jgi:hypothetical protein
MIRTAPAGTGVAVGLGSGVGVAQGVWLTVGVGEGAAPGGSVADAATVELGKADGEGAVLTAWERDEDVMAGWGKTGRVSDGVTEVTGALSQPARNTPSSSQAYVVRFSQRLTVLLTTNGHIGRSSRPAVTTLAEAAHRRPAYHVRW